jgi:hypothetical protein
MHWSGLYVVIAGALMLAGPHAEAKARNAAQTLVQVSAVPEFRAMRAERAPSIDGDLSDPAWNSAPEITGFIQRDPDEGKPATQQSFVKVVYDDHAIYIGARLDDDGPVTSRLGRRDSELQSDWFRVYLDPHDDHQTGASFWVNPANVQVDMVLYNDGWDDWNWDGVWESATQISESGWTVEMRIPYSQLRFPNRPRHTWGVNFIRRVSRLNEQSGLVYVPKNESGFVSRFAHLTGMEGIKAARSLELLPYAVTRADLSTSVAAADPFNSSPDFFGDVGLDLKYRLTSNLTLTGTINPDFGQVEVDPAVLNLSEFELFFPEKRPFFVEGSSLFEFGRGGSNNNFNINFFPPSFFYSRRIGRSPQGTSNLSYDFLDAPDQTTILGAAKITGKTGNGWTVAALDALTASEKAWYELESVRGRSEVEPMTNYLVTRIAKDSGEKGRIGFLVTSVNRDLPAELNYLRENAFTGGVDGYWAFGKRDVILEWFAGGTYVSGSEDAIQRTQSSSAHYYQRPDAGHVELDPTRTSLAGYGGRVTLAKQTGKWKYNLQAQSYSPGYETNDVGFLQRADATSTHGVVLYNNPDPWKRTRSRNFWVAHYQNYNWDGDVIGRGTLGDGFTSFQNYSYLCYWGGRNISAYDDRATRGGPVIGRPSTWWAGSCLGSDERKKLSAEIWSEVSGNSEGGDNQSVGLIFNYRPTSNLSVQLRPIYRQQEVFQQYVTTVADPSAVATFGNRYVFGEIDQRTFEMGTRVDWTFTSRLSLQLYLQPFIAAGDFHTFKEVERTRSISYRRYGQDGGSTLSYDPEANRYFADPDGPGGAAGFSFDNPDFKLRSLRANAILRWQFRPGSALYVVWNENRAAELDRGDFRFGRDLSDTFRADSDDVFLVKFSYYIGL